MKPLHTLPAVAVSLALAAPALAQSPEWMTAIKIHLHEQTSAAPPVEVPFLPFGCDLIVDGGVPNAPSVSGPMTVPEPTHNGGVLGWNFEWGEWSYGWPNFDNYGTQTLAELDTLFPNGVYTFDVGGVTVPLDLSGDLWSSAVPHLTLTGGVWLNGQYVVEVGQDVVITTNVFPEFGTQNQEGLWLDIEGEDYYTDVLQLPGVGVPNFLTHVIPANSLRIGHEYDVDAGFIRASDFSFSLPQFPGASGVAGYEVSTYLQIVVVPDDGPLGALDCSPAIPNSTGEPGRMFAGGSTTAAANDLTLYAVDLPANQFGFFLCSQNPGFVLNPGGADGILCLGFPIARLTDSLANSGALGQISYDVDLTNIPMTPPVAVVAGQTWRFQCWYRDVNPTPTANFTDVVEIVFQ